MGWLIMTITDDLKNKLNQLQKILTQYHRLVVAFSGGVDSAFLLKVAAMVLSPENLLAITARGPFFPAWEAEEATALAAGAGAHHLVVEFDVLSAPQVAPNPPDRCYHCKKALFQNLVNIAQDRGFTLIADGANQDDIQDFRPGARATRELGIVSPLKEAGLSKDDIRLLSAQLKLPTWDKPSFACLASRIPYGQAITQEKLKMVETAEDFLRSLGFRELRVRHHGEVARIEVGSSERSRFFDEVFMDKVDRELRQIGFAFAALDLRGFRSGAFNHQVEARILEKYKQ